MFDRFSVLQVSNIEVVNTCFKQYFENGPNSPQHQSLGPHIVKLMSNLFCCWRGKACLIKLSQTHYAMNPHAPDSCPGLLPPTCIVQPTWCCLQKHWCKRMLSTWCCLRDAVYKNTTATDVYSAAYVMLSRECCQHPTSVANYCCLRRLPLHVCILFHILCYIFSLHYYVLHVF